MQIMQLLAFRNVCIHEMKRNEMNRFVIYRYPYNLNNEL